MPVPPAKVSGTTTNGSVTAKEYDVIIVGAGFSGISALHRLRKDGMNPHIFEAGKTSDAYHDSSLTISQDLTSAAYGTGTAIPVHV
jgi:thioredoxin reductase